MTSIRLDHLTKTFSGATTPAVDDVSLDIADGEFVILVGPSGCGKSTILRMIVGLEDVTAGDVYIGDTQVNDKAPRDRNLAMVFQNYALYPHLNVYENIAFPLRLHHAPDDDVRTRVKRAADLLELDELLDRKPAHLSGCHPGLPRSGKTGIHKRRRPKACTRRGRSRGFGGYGSRTASLRAASGMTKA